VDVDLDDLLWNITFDGGIILIAEGTSGTIGNLAVAETVDIQSERLFGIGFPQIAVSIDDDVEKTVRGIVFGPLVLIIG